MGLRDIKPFGQMWALLNRFNRGAPGVFPPELLVGICWHESRFQNIGQIVGAGQAIGGHAIGFGQVERATIESINNMYGTRYPVGSPLTDQQSIELIGLALLQALESPQRKPKAQALHVYATGHMPRRMRHPGPLVQGWLNCEAELKFLRFGATPDFRDPAVIARIRTGLVHALPTSAPQELDFAVRTET